MFLKFTRFPCESDGSIKKGTKAEGVSRIDIDLINARARNNGKYNEFDNLCT